MTLGRSKENKLSNYQVAVTPATLEEGCYQFCCSVNRGTMGVNSWPKTDTRQRRDCDLNPGPSAPESSTLTTRLPSHPHECPSRNNVPPPCIAPKIVRTSLRRWAYSRCVSCEDRFTNVRPEIAYLLCRKPAEMRNQRGRRWTMRLSRKSRTEVAAAASELRLRECRGGG